MKTDVEIKRVVLERAINMLQALKAQYKIILNDGSEFGELEVVKSNRRPLRYPLGALRDYYSPFIKDMNVGDVVVVPIGDFDIDSIQGGICSFAGTTWGLKSVVTHRLPDENTVEVMRLY